MRRTIPILLQLAFLAVTCYPVPVPMHWTANSEEDMDRYEVSRMSGSEPYQVVDDAVPHVPVQVEIAPGVFEDRILFLDDTAEPGVVYVYRVRAEDECGNKGPYSDESVQIPTNDGIAPAKAATPEGD